MTVLTDEEVATSILEPYFRAVQDEFSAFEPERGFALVKLAKVKFIVDPKVHDSERHFAATRDDARLMYFAPQIVDLPPETLVAIIAHEFGHAADFAYPARWLMPDRGPGCARWIKNKDVEQTTKNGQRVDSKSFRAWSRSWADRDKDEGLGRDRIEWAADGIAEAVVGKPISYCGDPLLQCFCCGIERPAGLR